jgi:fatty-acyl-CoA synthase
MIKEKKMKDSFDLLHRNTIGDLLRKNARKYPENIAVKFYEEDGSITQLSYKDLNMKANRFVSALRGLGIKEKSVGAILSHNCIQFIIGAWGLVKANVTSTYINVNLVDHEIEYQINHSDAVILFVEDGLIDNVMKVVDGLKNIKYFVVINLNNKPIPKGWLKMEEFYSEKYEAIEHEIKIHDDDIAFRLYTSGTTAFPKGIDLTYKNAEYICRSYAQIHGGEDLIDKPWGYFLPLYHSGVMHMFSHTTNGSRLIIGTASNQGKMVDIIHEEQIIGLCFPVTIFTRLLERSDWMKKLTSLRMVWWFGGAMPLDVLEKWINVLPDVNIAAQWSQTECLVGTISWYNQKVGLPMAGNVIGRPYHDTEIMIVDENDNEVPDGIPGEIVMRSPAVMKGYYKNPEATAEAFKSGWHHTGDVGIRGKDSYYYFVDRVKDMIKTGGVNVSAVEVEIVLNSIKGIKGSAVFGVYHPDWTEAVVAAVVTDDKELTEEKIIVYCKERLGKFKVPKKVLFVDEIPISHIGKILRKKLREEYKNLFKAPVM